MKILYVSQYFPPEMGAPAARVAELSRYWAQDGHEVTVLTGFPNHPTGDRAAGVSAQISPAGCARGVGRSEGGPHLAASVSQSQDLRAHVELQFVLPFGVSHGTLSRAAGCGHRHFAAVAGWAFRLGGWPGANGARFVFEVRDLWPESLAAVGVGTKESLLHRALAKIAGFLYRNSDHIVVVTPAFKEYLVRALAGRAGENFGGGERGRDGAVQPAPGNAICEPNWVRKENL